MDGHVVDRTGEGASPAPVAVAPDASPAPVAVAPDMAPDAAPGSADRPARWVGLRRLAAGRPTERCQFENSMYRYDWPYRAARVLRHRARLYRNHVRAPVPPGRPSRFEVGDVVRVKDADGIRATLGPDDRLRGLWFTTNQWAYCGRTHRVERVVRRMPDDGGRMRSVSRTVALAGAVCDGPDGSVGCGRACSLFFRDEWLEPGALPLSPSPPPVAVVRVRPVEEIRATLDRHGRLDGVAFEPEMAAACGAIHGVLRPAEDVGVALPRWKHRRDEWYVLDGVRCSGAPLGGPGACDRNCGLLWHRAWIHVEHAASVTSTPQREATWRS